MAYVVFILFLVVWAGVTTLLFKAKGSAIESIGGGFGAAILAIILGSNVIADLIGNESDYTEPQLQSVAAAPASIDETPLEACEMARFTIGGCVSQKYHFADGTSRYRDIADLMMRGNYYYSTRREGEKCIANIYVKGMVRGNSYDASFSCKML